MDITFKCETCGCRLVTDPNYDDCPECLGDLLEIANFDIALGAFIDHVNTEYVAPERAKFKHLIEAEWVVRCQFDKKVKRYIRLVHSEYGKDRSVYCFVDTTNGDLLKGSWKAPVKNGVRGNIFDQSTYANFNHYGPNYLK